MTRCTFLIAIALVACGSNDGSGSATDGGADAAGAAGSGGTSGAGGSAGSGGSGGTSGAAGSAGASCGDFGLDATCKACLKSACCSASGACSASAGCASLVTCARGCQSPDAGANCLQGCLDQNPSGGSAYNELVLCKGNSCGSQCPQATP